MNKIKKMIRLFGGVTFAACAFSAKTHAAAEFTLYNIFHPKVNTTENQVPIGIRVISDTNTKVDVKFYDNGQLITDAACQFNNVSISDANNPKWFTCQKHFLRGFHEVKAEVKEVIAGANPFTKTKEYVITVPTVTVSVNPSNPFENIVSAQILLPPAVDGQPSRIRVWEGDGWHRGRAFCADYVENADPYWKEVTHTCPSKYFPEHNNNLNFVTCYDHISDVTYPCAQPTVTKGFVANEWADPSEWEQRRNDGPYQKNKIYDFNWWDRMIAGYFTEWGVRPSERNYQPKDLPVENMTHIFHSFLGICGDNESYGILNGQTALNNLNAKCIGKQDGELVILEPEVSLLGDVQMDSSESPDDPIRGIYAEYVRMKKVYPHIKVVPSIGGYSLSDPLFILAAQESSRAIFIDSVIEFLRTYPFFDGIDIDWEFPAHQWGPPGANYGPQDGPNFALLVSELRVALDQFYQETGRYHGIHGAFHGGKSVVQKITPNALRQIAQNMEHMNLMSYDYYGPWNKNAPIGHHTALFHSPEYDPDQLNADTTLRYLRDELGIEAHKLSIGVAMYARGWTSTKDPIAKNVAQLIWEAGIQDYKGVEQYRLSDCLPDCGDRLEYDSSAKAFLLHESNGEILTLDTAESVEIKAQYVNENGLGTIFWSMDGDSGTLLNAYHEGLGHDEIQKGSRQPVNLSLDTGEYVRFTFEAPDYVSNLTFKLRGDMRDADLYVKYDGEPTTSNYDCRGYTSSSNETCEINNPQAGIYHIMVRAYRGFENVNYSVEHQVNAP